MMCAIPERYGLCGIFLSMTRLYIAAFAARSEAFTVFPAGCALRACSGRTVGPACIWTAQFFSWRAQSFGGTVKKISKYINSYLPQSCSAGFLLPKRFISSGPSRMPLCWSIYACTIAAYWPKICKIGKVDLTSPAGTIKLNSNRVSSCARAGGHRRQKAAKARISEECDLIHQVTSIDGNGKIFGIGGDRGN